MPIPPRAAAYGHDELERARLLVTGGAGFVGSSLALRFRQQYPAMPVTVLDNLHRRGSELNLPRLRAAGIDFVHGDIRNDEDLERAGPADVIIEASAEPAVLAGFGAGHRYLVHSNLVGAIRCVEHALRSNAKLVFLSSSRVYPIAPVNALAFRELPTRYELAPQPGTLGASAAGIAENFTLSGARSLYGATKLCAELLIQEYAEAQGLQAVVNRCGVIAGPWQMGKVDQGVVAHWLLAHQRRQPLRYIGYEGSGKQTRDLLHVDDLFDAVHLQLTRFDQVRGGVFNLGGGLANTVSLLELTEACRRLTGIDLPVGRETQDRPGDLRFFITDARRLEAVLGWRPRRDVAQILSDTWHWIGQNLDLIERTL